MVSEDGRRIFMLLVHVIGRLAPGQTVESARAELDVVRRQAAATFYPAPAMSSAAALITRDALRVRPLHDQLVGDVRGRVWLLSGAIALLLLIACANVANLQVLRTLNRQRELAVRLAMGATRRRVAAQLLTEALVLAGQAAVVALPALHLDMGGLRPLTRVPAAFPNQPCQRTNGTTPQRSSAQLPSSACGPRFCGAACKLLKKSGLPRYLASVPR